MTAPRPTAVLDASALLAWLRGEPGADAVDAALDGAAMSAVNWAETWQKLEQNGVDAARALTQVRALGVVVVDFSTEDAAVAAGLWHSCRAAGLSLGDRACLALAIRLGLPAVTADAAWSRVEADLEPAVSISLVR